MLQLSLPPILYHGTSSRLASSTLSFGLNPHMTYTGRLVLTSEFNLAVNDAFDKTYWDRLNIEWLGCESGIDMQPVVYKIDTKGLDPILINSNLDNSEYGSNSGECPPRIAYLGIIPINRAGIVLVNNMRSALCH